MSADRHRYGDVKYNADRTLVIDRKKKPWTSEDSQKHIRSQVEKCAVTAIDGSEVDLPIEDKEVSLCCHSDSPGCLDIVHTARRIVDEFNKKTFG